MRKPVLVDTGPIVAFLDRRDAYHEWTVERWGELEPPLLSCESVLSEACFLLREQAGGPRAVMDLVVREVVALPYRVEAEAKELGRLMAKYADQQMSLADACLVRMAEANAGSVVLTVDSDFRVYRKHGRAIIPSILPPGK